MKRIQWDAFLKQQRDLGRIDNTGTLKLSVPMVATHYNSGPRQGEIVAVENLKASIVFDGGQTATLHYRHVDFLDEAGEIIVAPIRDLTGREIKAGSYIAYPRNHGTGRDILEVGRVESISDIGWLTVHTILRNGRNVRARKSLNTITTTSNCLKLPVDAPDMMLWVMKDFELEGIV